MSQQQPQKNPIKYGDVLPVQGELADKPIAPGDADMMRKAETAIIGRAPGGGAASVMQSAAARNEAAGVTGHDTVNQVMADQGVTITEQYVPGGRVLTETIGDQVVGQYIKEGPVVAGDQGGGQEISPITIGEALEAAAITAGHKAVEISDATAIKEAEVRATGRSDIAAGGITAAAQLAVTHNADVVGDDKKMKLSDVLTDATRKLPSDKAATRSDMTAVAAAEMRNHPNEASPYPAGIAASVAAAARINESDQRKGDQRTFTDFHT